MPERNINGTFAKGSIPTNKIVLPREELERVYKDNSSRATAKYFRVSKATVLRNLHEYGISVRIGVPKTLPEEWRRALCKPKSVPAWNKGLTKETDERLQRSSESTKGEKNHGWKPELHIDEMIECACGCGEMRPKFDKRGRRRYYIKGHSKTGQFKKGHKTWNKNKKMPESAIQRGDEASGYKDGRAIIPNFCIDCGAKIGYMAKRCVKCAHKMELNSSWLGGKSFESYGIEFNDELKVQIKIRDNYTCQECGCKQEDLEYSLNIHHIDYDKHNNDPNNLISLCRSCHMQTNFSREDWTDYFNKRCQIMGVGEKNDR